MVSVIIPTFNEEKSIRECLESLFNQTDKDLEIIVIDDGSTDKTLEVISAFRNPKLQILKQSHKGPGIARNLGVKIAKGEILVFVDADMTFDKFFIEKLIEPITKDGVIGTFSKQEFVLNKNNIWSKCWNINKGLPLNRMHSQSYPDTQKVFRAILKKEFEKSGGFKPIGYIDDYTISESLGKVAINAPKAFFYHRNPETLREVFYQARWIGKSEFKRRKIKNEALMKCVALIRYSPPLTLISGIIRAIESRLPQFIIFKIIYDLAIEISLIKSFFGEHSYK